MEKSAPLERPKVTVLYETKNFRVIVGKMSGPPDLADEMRLKYIIQSKRHGVIYGVTGHEGAAYVACEEAEKGMLDSIAILEEVQARTPPPAATGN